MSQPQVTFISTDNLDKTIVVAVHGRRIEFFIKPGYYDSSIREVRRSINQEWYNQALAKLITHSAFVTYDNNYLQCSPESVNQLRTRNNHMSRGLPEPTDYSKTPSTEFAFTLIAPTAKNALIYQGQRYWHKTDEAALEYAKFIYDANPTEKFELSIVEWKGNLRPKPQIELLVSRPEAPKTA